MQMLMTGDPITAQEAHRLGMVNEIHPRADLMPAALRIADAIANNSPTAVQAVKQAVRTSQGEPIEQAAAIMMEAHWRSVVHPTAWRESARSTRTGSRRSRIRSSDAQRELQSADDYDQLRQQDERPGPHAKDEAITAGPVRRRQEGN